MPSLCLCSIVYFGNPFLFFFLKVYGLDAKTHTFNCNAKKNYVWPSGLRFFFLSLFLDLCSLFLNFYLFQLVLTKKKPNQILRMKSYNCIQFSFWAFECIGRLSGSVCFKNAICKISEFVYIPETRREKRKKLLIYIVY